MRLHWVLEIANSCGNSKSYFDDKENSLQDTIVGIYQLTMKSNSVIFQALFHLKRYEANQGQGGDSCDVGTLIEE